MAAAAGAAALHLPGPGPSVHLDALDAILQGVGKTHLAISLAIAAAQSGRRVYYGTLADLMTSLEEAQAAGRLVHHCHPVTIRGNSYRMRQHTELWQALHANQDADPATPRRRRARQEVATT